MTISCVIFWGHIAGCAPQTLHIQTQDFSTFFSLSTFSPWSVITSPSHSNSTLFCPPTQPLYISWLSLQATTAPGTIFSPSLIHKPSQDLTHLIQGYNTSLCTPLCLDLSISRIFHHLQKIHGHIPLFPSLGRGVQYPFSSSLKLFCWFWMAVPPLLNPCGFCH